MNNQFFGDERDFYKYALLRALACDDLRIGVCWLFNDSPRDGGNKITYLCNEKHKLASMDSELFGFLRHYVHCQPNRNICLMEKPFNGKDVIKGAKYYRSVFPKRERDGYFDEMARQFAGCNLVFFDPDTGLRPSSQGKSDEYIEFCEIKKCWQTNRRASFMIFQYYHRSFCAKSLQTQKLRAERWDGLKQAAPNAEIYAIWKGPIAYYFLVRKQHRALLKKIIKAANKCGFVVVTPQP